MKTSATLGTKALNLFVKHSALTLLTVLALAACSKKSDSQPKSTLDTDRLRILKLKYDATSRTQCRLLIVRTRSATDPTPVDTMEYQSFTNMDGTWGMALKPSQWSGKAIFYYEDGQMPQAGDQLHVVVSQDEQPLPGREYWIGAGVPNGSGGTVTRVAGEVNMNLDSSR